MQTYDIEGALKAGITYSEIAQYLAKKHNFDYEAALKDGVSDEEIAKFLAERELPEEKALKKENNSHETGESKSDTAELGATASTIKTGDDIGLTITSTIISTSSLVLVTISLTIFFLWRRRKVQSSASQEQSEKKTDQQEANPPLHATETHYDRLKVVRDAPQEVIAAAYKSLSKIYHPDRNPGNSEASLTMALINSSYDMLSDPCKRHQYDTWLMEQERKVLRTGQPEKTKSNTANLSYSIRKYLPIASNHLFRYKVRYGLIILAILFWAFDRPNPPHQEKKPYLAHSRTSSPSRNKTTWVRPAIAPNGQPWPASAAYLTGYPPFQTNGLSSIMVDNSRNNSDVFCKLVSLDGLQPFPVRHFLIPSHMKFTLRNITSGNYDIRYRDLDNGGLARSEPFILEENPTSTGTQYSNITMTLYKVRNGNMQTYALPEEDF